MREPEIYTTDYYLLVYPTATAAACAARRAAMEAEAAAYWSKHSGSLVRFTEPNEALVFLEKEGTTAKIVSERGIIGWIKTPSWLELKPCVFE
jgi:hypothetical protein